MSVTETKVSRSDRLAIYFDLASLIAPRQGFQPEREHPSPAGISEKLEISSGGRSPNIPTRTHIG